MLLIELIKTTTLDVVVFVNADHVKSSLIKNKPIIIDFAGRSYMAVKDELFCPDGIEFDSKFDTLEVERIRCKFYENLKNKQVAVIEAYLG